MKRKVGDIVKVKSLEWYEANKDNGGAIKTPQYFTMEMAKYCGRECTISRVVGTYYYIDGFNDDRWSWDDEMFED